MNLEMYTVKEGAGLFRHCKRQLGEMFKDNDKHIDVSRSHLNSPMRTLPKAQHGEKIPFPDDYYDAINRYLAESESITGKKVSKNARCVVGVVVTMPRQYRPPEGTDFNKWYTEKQIREENHFYSRVVLFLLKKFGYYDEKLGPNFICAAVHRDEVSSHCHIQFIPVVKDTYEYDKKYTKDGKAYSRKIIVRKGSISAWNVVNKKVLKGIHQELDSFLRKEVAWYKGGIMLSPEERMQSGQNLKMDDLKSAGKDYAEKRAKENRRAFIAEAESFYGEALSAIRDDGRQASLVKLVEQLLKDKKLTVEDCETNPTYHEAYGIYKAFKRKLAEKAKAVRDSVTG